MNSFITRLCCRVFGHRPVEGAWLRESIWRPSWVRETYCGRCDTTLATAYAVGKRPTDEAPRPLEMA